MFHFVVIVYGMKPLYVGNVPISGMVCPSVDRPFLVEVCPVHLWLGLTLVSRMQGLLEGIP